ncbi:helix-turn-helix transcriptional regulator [Mesorhizobium loti]|uniref:Transcriptional regulator n=1 Tax=Mesorhizobium loti R88b TaxID=935548 RepID=A0A6M7WGD3_RHILI|nr:transcriptional regulator [Mesorhizobium loti R88b]
MQKTTMPIPTMAPPSAIEIARRAARSGNADIGTPSGFAEHGGVPLVPVPGGRDVVVPVKGVEIKAFSPDVRVTLPRMLESDAKEQATTPIRTKGAEAELTTIGSPADLGRLVRKVREGRGLSQQEFADLAGVGRRFLSELENGKPTLELGKVLKVANAAGIALLARER